jgi:kynureninase
MALRSDCELRDRDDPLARRRDAFELPEGVIYLDGNSLGPLPKGVSERVREVVEREWGEDLIRSWNSAGWIDLPRKAGAKIAPLIGAAPDEVLVADSTSIDLYKLVAAALEARPGRNVVVSERDNFPTDLYVIQGLARSARAFGGQHGRPIELRTIGRREDLDGTLDDDVAVVVLTQVDYRTGECWHLADVTRRVRDAGALMLWDLAHSTGAVPVDLTAAGADLAVGCGYKYLNGGPGAPAFLYVAKRHQRTLRSPLQGWLGHAEPFAFEREYRPAGGIDLFQAGTPAILSLAALDAALDVFDGVDMEVVREKSVALSELFLERVAAECGELGVEIACPRQAAHRGSQVSLRHPEGYAIVQALIARGVIGDFRTPDVLRFGLAPLYLRYVDVWDAVGHLREVLEGREYEREEFRTRAAVT